MKNILSLLGCLFVSSALMAQAGTITISPTTFTAEDDITVTIDVTGTPMAGEAEAYIWTWCNKEAAGYIERSAVFNTDWGNSELNSKMTNVGPNKWSFTFRGTDAYGLTPAQLKHFQMLAKSKTGSKQTADSPKFPFDPLVFTPSQSRTFPAKFGQDDAVTLYFHQNLATSPDTERMTPTEFVISFYNQSDVQVGSEITVAAFNEGNSMYSYSLIPARAVTVPVGSSLKKIRYKVKGTVLDVNGAPANVETETFEKTIDL